MITEIAEEEDESSSSDDDSTSKNKTGGNNESSSQRTGGENASPPVKKVNPPPPVVQQEEKRDKILTFRDMSHLSYFGMEGKAFKHTTTNIQTSKDIIKEIIEDLLELVFEEGGKTKQDSEIVDDYLIESNFAQLRKKVFVKEKVLP